MKNKIAGAATSLLATRILLSRVIGRSPALGVAVAGPSVRPGSAPNARSASGGGEGGGDSAACVRLFGAAGKAATAAGLWCRAADKIVINATAVPSRESPCEA